MTEHKSSLRNVIRERIPDFIPRNAQPWFNLGSNGGIVPHSDGHDLYVRSSDQIAKVEPVFLTTDEVWMLGEALLVYAESHRKDTDDRT